MKFSYRGYVPEKINTRRLEQTMRTFSKDKTRFHSIPCVTRVRRRSFQGTGAHVHYVYRPMARTAHGWRPNEFLRDTFDAAVTLTEELRAIYHRHIPLDLLTDSKAHFDVILKGSKTSLDARSSRCTRRLFRLHHLRIRFRAQQAQFRSLTMDYSLSHITILTIFALQ